MTTAPASPFPPLTFTGRQMKTDPAHMGLLRDSSGLRHDVAALRQRMEADGYLYLPGLLDRDVVLDARRSVLEGLQAEGALHPDHPLMEGVARPDVEFSFRPDLAAKNEAVARAVYDGAMVDFFTDFLGGEVRHFDYTWLRAKAPGTNTATKPHCDVVFMSRGTRQLYTAWTPLGDVPYELGGLMVLEGSHRRSEHLSEYWEFDVDTYCVADSSDAAHEQWAWDASGGAFSRDAVALREQVGGRWLTHEYRAGDVLVFCMTLLHASLDNQTDRIRLSTDTRYQLASEPVDERWIGEHPIAHGEAAKQGVIC